MIPFFKYNIWNILVSLELIVFNKINEFGFYHNILMLIRL